MVEKIKLVMDPVTLRMMFGKTATGRTVRYQTGEPLTTSYYTGSDNLMTLGDALIIGIDFLLVPEAREVSFPTQNGQTMVMFKGREQKGSGVVPVNVQFVAEGVDE
jgi:hypothetical protein